MIKLTDITFVKPVIEGILPDIIFVYKKVSRPNKETITLITALLNSLNFQKFITDMREESVYYGEPKSWVVADINHDIHQFFASDRDFVIGLLMDYDLWDGLTDSIMMLIRYDIFPVLDISKFPDIRYFPDNAEIGEYMQYTQENHQKLTGITFSHIVSKTEFIEWVNMNWDEIEKWNSRYLLQSPILKDKLQDIKLIDQVFQMYKDGLSAKQISVKLSDKYPSHKYIGDYAWVSNKILHYKERIAKYSKRFN
jgi:hypothetical protein